MSAPVEALFQPFRLGALELPTRVVMAPMTRNFSPGGVPNAKVVEYYRRRAAAGVGLIVSEGTTVGHKAANGYPNVPRFYGEDALAGWKQVVDAVHAEGGRIVPQLWHVGSVRRLGVEPDASVPGYGPMEKAKDGKVLVHGMSKADIQEVIAAFAQAARDAQAIGMDGVEIHGAHGYLIDQFLASASNRRSDAYGGSLENRARFLLEIVDALVAAVGAERVGLRLSPWGTINDMHDDEPEAMTLYLAEALQRRGIAYLHLAEWEWSGGPAYPQGFRERLRERFRAPLIVCGNYDAERAEAILQAGLADAVAIGRPFIANPDLVERIRLGAPLAEANQARFYGGDAAGYTDYPTLGQSATA